MSIIDSIPSLLLFRDGKVAGQHMGLASKSSLRRLLSR
jgi:thioredoxin-like negative regulator of GroEL